jgi:predicted nucleotidyltransferase
MVRWSIPTFPLRPVNEVGLESSLPLLSKYSAYSSWNIDLGVGMLITEEEINGVVEKIIKGYNPEKIILFGSYSAGNPNENSDIDLFVVKDTDKPRPERAIELRKMLYGSKLPIDLIVYNQKEIDETRKNNIGLEMRYLETGKVMYERHS